MNKRDTYMPDIMVETGELFEKAVGKYNYDIEGFATDYLSSFLRETIDERAAYTSTMSAEEMMEYFNKSGENKAKRNTGVLYSPFLANWIGCFYTMLQYKTGMPSRELIKRYPVGVIMKKANVMHDLDLQLAVEKVIGR